MNPYQDENILQFCNSHPNNCKSVNLKQKGGEASNLEVINIDIDKIRPLNQRAVKTKPGVQR